MSSSSLSPTAMTSSADATASASASLPSSRSSLQAEEEEEPIMQTTLTAKYGKETITIPNLPSHNTTISTVKNLILQHTNILPKRQKLIGLTLRKSPPSESVAATATATAATTNKRKVLTDETTLDKLQIKKPKDAKKNKKGQIIHAHHSFILMGTPETEIFIDLNDCNDANTALLDNVVNDFDLDFNIGSSEWKAHFANQQNLIKFTNSTEVHIMNPPREGKKLMVLDLDHTLLDFSSKKIINTANSDVASAASAVTSSSSDGMTVQETINQMKRPYMDQFLAEMYVHYDLVVWSQTSWRWLETKLVELGMLTNPNYRFCFVLDKTSMFAITSTRRNGQKVKHYVKPLQIIWSKFPKTWDASNTVHLDDLSRNFALNLDNGLKVSAYYRKKKKNSRNTSTGNRDVELIGLIGYCGKLAREVDDFRDVDFKYWKDVVNGTKDLITKK
jgi:ubiquitin-like domain-containing CTD phosphatase 1